MTPTPQDLSRHTFVLLLGQRYEFVNLGGHSSDHLTISSVAGTAEQRLSASGSVALIEHAREDGRVFIYAATKVDKSSDGRPGTKYIHVVECPKPQVESLQHAMEAAYRGIQGVRSFAETQYASKEVSMEALRELAACVEQSLQTEQQSTRATPPRSPQKSANRWSFSWGKKLLPSEQAGGTSVDSTDSKRGRSASSKDESGKKPLTNEQAGGAGVDSTDSKPRSASSKDESGVPSAEEVRQVRISSFVAVFFLGAACGTAVGVALGLAPAVGIVLLALSLACMLAFAALFRRLDQLRRETRASHQHILSALHNLERSPNPSPEGRPDVPVSTVRQSF